MRASLGLRCEKSLAIHLIPYFTHSADFLVVKNILKFISPHHKDFLIQYFQYIKCNYKNIATQFIGFMLYFIGPSLGQDELIFSVC